MNRCTDASPTCLLQLRKQLHIHLKACSVKKDKHPQHQQEQQQEQQQQQQDAIRKLHTGRLMWFLLMHRRCRIVSSFSESAPFPQQNSANRISHQAVEATRQKPVKYPRQQQQQQQQQEEEGDEALVKVASTAAPAAAETTAAPPAPPDPAAAAASETAATSGAPRVLSGKAQRRAVKREQKLQKLLLKREQEEKREHARQLRHKLNETIFDLKEAVARKIVQPFVLGTNNPEAETPGTPAAIAAAAAAAAAAPPAAPAAPAAAAPTPAAELQEEGGAIAVLKGLFTGSTPFLLMRAKLRTVQASVQMKKEEGNQKKEKGRMEIVEKEQTEIIRQQSPKCMHAEIPEKQLLQATWDEENGKESQTIFTQVAYCGETNTSFLLAMPITGRSHQIRKHVALLGVSRSTFYSFMPNTLEAN
ncbi:hypothetical protein ACSSS7_000014 [Eimeria intestinalis]